MFSTSWMNKTNISSFICKNCLRCLQQRPVSHATVLVHHGECSADCPYPEDCGNDRIIINQIKSFELCPDGEVRCTNIYLSRSWSNSAAFPCWSRMTNGVKLAHSGIWPHLTRDKEKWRPTFLSSSLLAWLASRSELIEASCSTSWAFSTFISSSWELRASTWAECSLTSVSNLPICNRLSVEPPRYSMIKTQPSYILILFLTTGTWRSFPHSLTWECITLMLSLVQSCLQTRVFALCGSEFLAHLLQSLL